VFTVKYYPVLTRNRMHTKTIGVFSCLSLSLKLQKVCVHLPYLTAVEECMIQNGLLWTFRLSERQEVSWVAEPLLASQGLFSMLSHVVTIQSISSFQMLLNKDTVTQTEHYAAGDIWWESYCEAHRPSDPVGRRWDTGIKLPVAKSDNFLPSNARVENGWSFASIPSSVIMVWYLDRS
jgi:hypothetical protein